MFLILILTIKSRSNLYFKFHISLFALLIMVWRIIDCYRRFIRLLCAFLLWIFKFQTLSIQCNRITKGNPELLFFRKSDGFAIIQSYIAV